ncbi:hypothetical protein QF004_000325 [Chryseobacterium sp. MDT2-18]|nr:hypothetical protein [Chryseobacterium sp. MDT2-18]
MFKSLKKKHFFLTLSYSGKLRFEGQKSNFVATVFIEIIPTRKPLQ